MSKGQKFRDPVTTPPFRIQFPKALYEPQINDKGKSVFSPSALFPPGTKGLDALEAELRAAVKDEWPALNGELPPKSKEWPIRLAKDFGSVDKKTGEWFNYPGHEACEFWTRLTTYNQPTVYDLTGNEVDPKSIRAGDYMRARVIAHPYRNESTGVRLMVNSFQLIRRCREDEKFASNKVKPRFEFDVVTDEEAAKLSADANF